MNEQYPSILLERAINALAGLPGVGRKTALRLSLFLLKQDEAIVETFAQSILDFKKKIHYCKVCHNLSDNEKCEICANPHRDQTTICVVENVQDVMAIENTQQYNGTYHVLGALISPMDGIGPKDLAIPSLIERIDKGNIKELIFALSPTMEGDTTSFYISKKITNSQLKLSTIARGITIGNDLEYADEVTLGRSIVNRVAFNMNEKIN